MTVRRFADLADAGRQLAAALANAYAGRDGVAVVGVDPYGLEVARAAAEVLVLPVTGIPRDGPSPDGIAGRVVILVDDGVEGGGTATRLAAVLRAAGPQRLVLAVPVCPREPYAALLRIYDDVIALERPLMARSLTWHYTNAPGDKGFPGSETPQVP